MLLSSAVLDLACFLFAFFVRYLRLIVSVIAFAKHRSVKPLDEEKRSFGPKDTTVIIPTLEGDSPQIRDTVSTILKNDPFEVILVTIAKNHAKALDLAAYFGGKRITVRSTPQANKRLQMLEGLRYVQTDFTIFSDDDVFWKPRTLLWLLAPFEDRHVGGTGTCQRLRRATSPSCKQRFWNFCGAVYLERRNFDCGSCNAIDGGVPCLSGRTAMYRSDILKDPNFQNGFKSELWRGSRLNQADDDNFLTRWLVSHGNQIRIQFSDECEIETTLADDYKFLLQCTRWSRSNWRSNLTSLFVEKFIWSSQPWSTYCVFQTTLTAWALPWDALLLYLLVQAAQHWSSRLRTVVYVLYTVYWLWARVVKLAGHFKRFPGDILLLPVSILFGYFHSIIIKPWALWTIDCTTWGSRAEADVDDDWRMAQPPPYQTAQTMELHMTMLSELEAQRRLPPPPPHRLSSSRPASPSLLD